MRLPGIPDIRTVNSLAYIPKQLVGSESTRDDNLRATGNFSKYK